MSLDEIVAKNLDSLIEKRGETIANMARDLGVSRAQVYDMLKVRPGRPQREFKWSEIVRLASLLDVLVFDLVLPPEDVVLDAGQWVTRFQSADLWDMPDDETEHLHVGALTRAEVGLALFGLPGDYLSQESVKRMRRERELSKEQRSQAVAEELDTLMRGLEEIQERAKSLVEKLGE